MFPYLEAFAAFSFGVYLFETYLERRQYAKLCQTTLPKELDFVNQEKFLKSQEYGRAKNHYGFIHSTVGIVHSLVFLLFKITPFLWSLSYDWTASLGLNPDREIFRATVFMIVLGLYNWITELPFDLYYTFVLEERFGFNKQTLKLMFIDTLKSWALSLVIGVPILALILMVIEWGGKFFWIYLWFLTIAISLIGVTIYPIWIAPLFNKYAEMEEGETRSAIYELAKRNEFPLTKLYVVDGSLRSNHSNAYFFGFFKNKRIVIYDTLLKQVEKEELVGILGHELGHWKMNHTTFNLFIGFSYYLIFYYIFGMTLGNDDIQKSFGYDGKSAFIGLMLFSYIYSPVEHAFGFVMNIISRTFEFQADEFAVKQNYGEPLRRALIKIHEENLSNVIVDEMYAAYHHSHPVLLERLKAIDAQMKRTQ